MQRTRTIVLGLLLATVSLVSLRTSLAQDSAGESADIEREMIAVLRSQSPAAEKAVACKHLSIHGSSLAVGELAPLLADPQLASWARIALEAIPGSAADQALLDAVGTLQGNLLVGTIRSIGVRRVAAGVETLTSLLKHENAQVAAAAAIALGQIGDSAAESALRAAFDTNDASVRSAVAEACILIAEVRLAAGESTAATELYDLVRSADVPRQRVIEATRGAILARDESGIPLLVEQLQSEDQPSFQLALSIIREFPGDEIDTMLAEQLEHTPPARAALLIQAMTDRSETVVLPAVLRAAETGPTAVQLSAIEALGRVGDVSCLATLLQMAEQSESELAEASIAALATLPGDDVDQQILTLLRDAQGRDLALLIELVGERRLQVPEVLFGAVRNTDLEVRQAAFEALGKTVAPDELLALIGLVIEPDHASDTAIAQQALRTASVRMPDRDACAEKLARAVERSDSDTAAAILEMLAEVGGEHALAALGRAARGADPLLQDVGSRLLGKWNSVAAAPLLLDLARSSPETKYQIRALRGYIGIVRKFELPDGERAEMCRQALAAAIRPDERRLVLDVLQLYPSRETLQLAIDLLQDPEVKLAAMQTVLAIAPQVADHQRDMEQLMADAGFDPVSLEIVKAEYGSGSTWVDVTAEIKKHVGRLPWISLPVDNYNAAFGGDPLPGTAKQLKLTYRLNGEQNSMTFAENAPIVLTASR